MPCSLGACAARRLVDRAAPRASARRDRGYPQIDAPAATYVAVAMS